MKAFQSCTILEKIFPRWDRHSCLSKGDEKSRRAQMSTPPDHRYFQQPLRISNLAVFVFAVLIIGCSGKRSQPEHGTTGDSTKLADSTAQASGGQIGHRLSYEQRQGKFLYGKYCAVCHGDDGKGDGFNAHNLDPKPRDFTDAKLMDALNDERIVQTISGGGRSVNRSIMMPSWGGRMNNEEIRYVVSYIRMFATSK